MYDIYIGVDIAKSKFDVVCYFVSDDRYTTSAQYSNDVDGIVKFKSFLIDLNTTNMLVAIESTAHYHRVLAQTLSNNFNVCVFNPLITNNAHKANIRKTKNDSIDAKIIGRLAYDQNLVSNYSPSSNLESLKDLTRFRHDLVQKRSRIKTQLHATLDIVCSEYETLFNDLFGKSSIQLLSSYTLNELLEMHGNKFNKVFKECVNGNSKTTSNDLKVVLKKHEQLIKNYAQLCYKLKLQAEEIVFYNHQITDVEKQISNEYSKYMEENTVIDLTTIPGIGEISAAIILSEFGDINRFDSPKQLVAYAGIDPKTYQSGNFNSSSGGISKRGSSNLRNALFMSANAAKLHNEEFAKLYKHFKDKGKHHYVCITAISRKMLHIIWGMNKHNTNFDESFVFTH